MFANLAKRFFGSANDRYVKGLDQLVAAINAYLPTPSRAFSPGTLFLLRRAGVRIVGLPNDLKQKSAGVGVARLAPFAARECHR